MMVRYAYPNAKAEEVPQCARGPILCGVGVKEGIQWTHFLDEELRRCNKTKRGVTYLRDLHKSQLPHQFFMGAELARVGAEKKGAFKAMLETRADFLHRGEVLGHAWWGSALFCVDAPSASHHDINFLLNHNEGAADAAGGDEILLWETAAPHDGAPEVPVVILPPSDVARVTRPPAPVRANKEPPLCVVGIPAPVSPLGVRHMVRFSSSAGDFPSGFATAPTPVRRFAAASCYGSNPVICTLIEEAKTSTEWMAYVHTARPVRTDSVCLALVTANAAVYPDLAGTFYIDETRYSNVKRHAFARIQHFRFFCAQLLAAAAATAGDASAEK